MKNNNINDNHLYYYQMQQSQMQQPTLNKNSYTIDKKKTLKKDRRNILKSWSILKKFDKEVVSKFHQFVDMKYDHEDIDDLLFSSSRLSDFYNDIQDFIKSKKSNVDNYMELVNWYTGEIMHLDLFVQKFNDTELDKIYEDMIESDYIPKFTDYSCFTT